MATELRKLGPDDPAVVEFLAAHETYVFQEPAWLAAMAALGHEVAYYALTDGGDLVLAQPAVRMRLSFFRLLYCGLPYGGPVGDVSRTPDLADRLAGAARREGIHRLRFSRNHYDPPLDLPGARVREHVQQVLHFGGRDRDALWADFKKRVRRDVRLAERRGVEVDEARTPEARDAIFRMYAATMVRNESFAVWSREMLEVVWRRLVEPGRGQFLVARHEGEPLAGMLLLFSGPRCFYFLGASSGAKRTLCPNDALIWDAITRAMDRGCEDFDFMISSRDDQALIDFKAKWGTERHPFRFHERNVRPVWCACWDLAFKVAQTHWGAKLVRRMRGGGRA